MQENTTLLIGGGYSNTALLQQTVQQLIKSGAPLDGVTIKLCDSRKENIAGGIAYAASDPVFQMGDVIRGLFVPYRKWLVENRERWVKWYEHVGGDEAKKWVAEHKDQLESPNFGAVSTESFSRTMYFPRIVFGLYLKDVLRDTIREGEEHGAKIELYETRVTDLSHKEDGSFDASLSPEHTKQVEMVPDDFGGYKFNTLPDNVAHEVIADNVVLATGMPVGRGFPDANNETGYFCSPYETSDEGKSQMQRIKKLIRAHHGETGQRVEVVLVGAGYRSQDVTLAIAHDKELASMVHVTAVEAFDKSWSPWVDPSLPPYKGDYKPQSLTRANMAALCQREAAGEDAMELKKTMNELVHQEVESVQAAQVPLDVVRQAIHKCIALLPGSIQQYSTEFVRRIPATNPEMAKAILDLKEAGAHDSKTEMVGNIRKGTSKALDVVRPDGSTIVHADVVINCMGPPPKIMDNKSPFIQTLLHKELIKPNASGRGVQTMLDRQCPDVPGLYALGPLLMDNEYPEAKARHARHHDIGVLHSCYYDAEAASGSLVSRITGRQQGRGAMGEWTDIEKQRHHEQAVASSVTSTVLR